MRRLAALVTVLFALTARAQAVIDSGMSRTQVVERFGKPLAERTAGTQTYLFYRNGAERRAGMQDVVILDGDKVVDALLRGTTHRYSGRSSSPVEISAATARARGRGQPPAATVAQPGTTRGAAGAAAAPSSASVLPAAKAQQEDVARPMPPAGSGERNARKAAAAAGAAAAAAKAAADSTAAARKPAAPNSAPTKKP